MSEKKKVQRDPRFIRQTMLLNCGWAAPMLHRLHSLLLATEQASGTDLGTFEANYTESYKQLVFLPLAMQQLLSVFEQGSRQRYYADFAQDYGDAVMTLHTLGWVLLDNDYENAIKASATLIMTTWGAQQGTENKKGWFGFWPAFQMRGCQQGRDKIWVVHWGNQNDTITLETHHDGLTGPTLTVKP